MFALVGPWGVLACIGAGLYMALVAAAMAEAGSRFARSGGVYLFAAEAFGPRTGFVAGWLSTWARLLSYAGIANLCAIYASALVPAVAFGAGRFLFITALTLALAVPVYFGVRLSAVAHNAFTAGKLALLALFVLCALPALFAGPPQPIPPAPLPAFDQWVPALVILLYALNGVDGVVVSNAEMRAPARDLPPALFIGMGVAVAVYCAVLLGAEALVPDLAHAARPIYDGIVLTLGPEAGWFVALGAVGSAAGVMFVILFVSPRMLAAMADSGHMPGVLGRLDPRHKTPGAAILATTLACWALALGFGFIGAASSASLTRLVFYGATPIAVVLLARRGIAEAASPLALPCPRLRAAIVAGIGAWLLARADWASIRPVLAILASGIALSFFIRPAARRFA